MVNEGKPRGGVSCFVVPGYLRHIKYIDTKIPDNIIVTFKNGDVVFASYIAPCDSPYSNITDFSNVANVFTSMNENCVVLGGGDMNGRVADIKTKLPAGMVYRPNVDSVMNDHGKEIIKICKSFKCFIVNNLNFNGKIFDGEFTFYKGGRKSQNDIRTFYRT